MTNLPEGFNGWTLDQKSKYWDKQRACRQKAIDKLSQEQRDAVKGAYDAISTAMQSLHECQDLWMSDVKNLGDSMWPLRRQFNLEVKDD